MILNYRLLLPLVLLCTTCSSYAEDRWFEIELLLFQRNVDIQDVKEDLALENAIIDTSKSVPLLKIQQNNSCNKQAITENVSNNLVNTANQQIQCVPEKTTKLPVLVDNTLFANQVNGFKLLGNDQLQLTPQREKLEQHALFKPLLHLAWRMPVKSRAKSIPIHLVAGENFADSLGQSQKSEPITVNDDLLENEPISPDELFGKNNNLKEEKDLIKNNQIIQPDKWTIDGNLKIYLEHYLFVDSQLHIRQKTTEKITTPTVESDEPKYEIINDVNDVQVVNFNETLTPKYKTVISEVLFDQNRRLRSGEIHYFDHPLMGMIIQIRKIPEEELTDMLEKDALASNQ